jgi:SAM-dependent methyltransferase
VSRFSKDWLSLREIADRTARNTQLLTHLRAPRTGGMRVVDLGAGTGGNLRYLAPRLKLPQQWTLLDADVGVLESVVVPEIGAPLRVEKRRLDLAQDLEELNLEECTLVTASAFFDLVSQDWLNRLARKCAQANVANGLFALSVDGRISWTPEDSDDEKIRGAFNAHMRRDKGFGSALGALAPAALAREFEAAGYHVWSEDSSWRLGAGDSELQLYLLQGYLEAASEQNPGLSNMIEEWAERRRAHIARGQSKLVVGHRDVVARLD